MVFFNLRRRLPCISSLILISALTFLQQAVASERVFISSDQFEVTDQDIRLYLNAPVSPDGQITWGSRDRVRQAMRDLYTLKALDLEATAAGVLTEEERAWVAYYQVALAGVRKLVAHNVENMMADIDWVAEAEEYYLANKEEFLLPTRGKKKKKTTKFAKLKMMMRRKEQAKQRRKRTMSKKLWRQKRKMSRGR